MIILFNPHAAPRRAVNLRLFPQPLLHGRFRLSRLINLLETPGLQLIRLEDLPRHRLARSRRVVEMMRRSTTHLTTLLHRMACPLLRQFPPAGALRLLHPLLRSQ